MNKNTRGALILIYACSGIAVSFFIIKNYCLNIPEESVRILERIGKWMEKNSAAVYGNGICSMPKPE